MVRGSIPGEVMWDLWWTKWHWDRFSLSTSVSPANSHSIHESSSHQTRSSLDTDSAVKLPTYKLRGTRPVYYFLQESPL
jgi:hypothetical protein